MKKLKDVKAEFMKNKEFRKEYYRFKKIFKKKTKMISKKNNKYIILI